MSKRNSGGSPPKAKRKAPDTGNKNEDISNMLSQLSDYEKNVTNNVFKAKAYKKAAHAVCQAIWYYAHELYCMVEGALFRQAPTFALKN